MRAPIPEPIPEPAPDLIPDPDPAPTTPAADTAQPTAVPPGRDPAAASRLHASATVRWILWIAGSLALILGILGVFLPVLPTTPFILLAAACYARASPRFHGWLLAHPTFGPTIRNWEENRSVARKTKKVAITMMTLSIAVSIWVVREHPWLQFLLATIAVSVGTWMWRLPEHGEPALSSPSSADAASR